MDETFDRDGYATVADRILLFYERYPQGRIISDLVDRSDHIVLFRARVYRAPDESRPAATGWASEREGDGDINTVACVENTETSAIGRALANLGFTASRQRPSVEEMAKASRARARIARERVEAERAVATSKAELRAPVIASLTSPRRVAASVLPTPPIVADLLRLIDVAERCGVRPRRAAIWREGVRAASSATPLLERAEQRLRAWLVRHRSARR
jgi:hypothetical protein